jgi:hypothetical protein
VNKTKPKQTKAKMSSLTNYEVEVLPNGKWRNLKPDYVVFNDHIKEGLHECPECKCSFCQEPSVVTLLQATHNTNGTSCGLKYCFDCSMIEYKKQRKEKQQAQAEQAQAQ